MKFLAAIALFPALAAAALGPDVRLSGHRLMGKPAAHHIPLEQTIEIVENESCPHRVTGNASIEIGGNCTYLSGVYRYVHQPEGNEAKRQVMTGFSVTLPGPASHVLLVSTPMTVVESTR